MAYELVLKPTVLTQVLAVNKADVARPMERIEQPHRGARHGERTTGRFPVAAATIGQSIEHGVPA